MLQECPIQVVLSELDKPSQTPLALLQQMYSKNGVKARI